MKAIQIPWNVQIITFDFEKTSDVSIMDSNNQYSASSSSVLTTQFPEQTSVKYSSRNTTPSVPLNFKELWFLAGIKGCVNFNMTNPVTKKNLLIRRIQQYKGLL